MNRDGPPRDDTGKKTGVQIIEGPNHIIELGNGRVHVRVFTRPDTDLQSGARFAGSLADQLIAMAELPEDQAQYCVIDVIAAPSITGPKTRAEIARFATAWEHARRPLLIVVGDEAIKDIQFRGMMREHAPSHGRRVFSEAEAHATAHRMMQRSR